MIQLPEIKIKKILYATDLSDSARHVFAHAVSLAEKYGAGITLLHVIYDVPGFVDHSVNAYINPEQWNQIKKRHVEDARQALIGKKKEYVIIKEVLNQFAENAQEEGVSTYRIDEVIVENGHPVEVILEVADSRNCDIIVMGKTGQGVIEGAVMGSTATRVLRRSKKPVLVVRYPD